MVGKGVTGAVRYALGEGRGAGNDNLAPGEQSRVGWISGTGFGFAIRDHNDAELARRIMEFDALNQTSPTRRCEKDVVHLALSWRPGETPSRVEMEAAAHGALKAMGMENAKALFVSHTDEAHPHLHIVASKINPDTGRAYDLKGNYLKLSRWALAWEREHGGVVCLRRDEASQLRQAIEERDAGAVLAHMTERRSTFTAADLERALGKQIAGEFDRAQFGNAVLAQADVVRLSDREGGPTTRYTTKPVLAAEQHVLRAAAGLARHGGHALGDRGRAVLRQERYGSIRSDQKRAFEQATGPTGLALIDGQAGTGKSYTMAAIREAYEAEGHHVIGLAPTNAVAQDMARDGFRQAGTVHSELFALNNDRRAWNGGTVVMVDEAAMLDTRTMAILTAHAHHSGAKLILIGDDRQLASIERGGMFGALKDRHGAAGLTEVTRQYKQEDRRAASMLAEGNFHAALGIYQDKGAITWTRTQEQARAALVEAWTRDSAAAPEQSRFVFAYTNADVLQLNRELRAVRRTQGGLGPDHMLPTADGRQAFAAGDRLQFTGTDKKLGIANGVTGTIRAIDGTEVTVELDSRAGGMRTFDAASFGQFRHGYAGTIYKGQGRTLDQTYLYHSEHWRSAASYVGLTRHRDKAELFVATNTARDVTHLARQMARVDDRRAASQFHQGRAAQEMQAPLTPRELMGELGIQRAPARVATMDAGMAAQQREAQKVAGSGKKLVRFEERHPTSDRDRTR
jgi:Ti-type conjugative transfer relaxase TraA